MIVCKQCGNQNAEDDDFCGSCGGFLEFTGERVEEPAAPPPPAEEVIDLRPGFIDRVKDAVGIGEHDDRSGPTQGGVTYQQQVQAPSREAVEAERIRAEADRKRGEALAAQAAAEQARRDAAAARAEEERALQARAEADQARRQAEQTQVTPFPPRPGSPEANAGDATVRQAESQQVEAALAARQAEEARAEADRIRREAEAEAARMRAEAEAEIARARRAAALVAPPAPTPPPQGRSGGPGAPAAAAGPGPGVPGAPTVRPPAAGAPPGAPDVRQPVAVRPGEARARPKPVATQPSSRTINPGDLICGGCGEGNEPTRRFCRRCGSSLVEAVVARTPWYRRVFGRRKKVVAAGERPGIRDGRSGAKRKGGGGRAIKTGVIAAVAIGIVGVGALKGPAFFKEAKDKIKPTFVPVQPAEASADSSALGRGPEFLIDRISNKFWAEGAPGNGEGTSVEVRFQVPTDVARILITPGASKKPEEFTQQPRPGKISVVFDDGTSKTLTLTDEAKPQEVRVDAENVTQMRLTIQTTYPSLGGTDCAIAEIEFFQLKVGS